MQRITKDLAKGDRDTAEGGQEERHKREKKGGNVGGDSTRKRWGRATIGHDLLDRVTLGGNMVVHQR